MPNCLFEDISTCTDKYLPVYRKHLYLNWFLVISSECCESKDKYIEILGVL